MQLHHIVWLILVLLILVWVYRQHTAQMSAMSTSSNPGLY